jgi:hypothetical protein
MNDFAHLANLISGAAIGLALTPFLLLALAIPYAVLRLRGQEGLEQDHQVGIKVFFHYFFSLAVLLFLTGVTVIAIDAVQEREPMPFGGPPARPVQPAPKFSEFNAAQRTGAALALTGLIFAVLHWVLVKMLTNDRRWPAARRVFAGWRLSVHGLVLFATAIVLMINLFEITVNIQLVKTTLAIGFIWSLAWVIDLFVLWLHSRPVKRDERPRRAILTEEA